MTIYWIIFIAIALASWLVSYSLKQKFERYSKEALPMNGRDVAAKMLRDHGITDVQITHVDGRLTDHYNPATKTVNLSKDVYYGTNVAAAAVAAHECGHAVQHATAYAPLKMRSALVPVVSFASNWMTWILLAGMLLIESFPQILLAGIGLFALTTLFSFITLPVEVNASQRAVNWLQESGLTDRETTEMASDALHSAAYTYVVAALSSLATLVYYILIFLGGNRR
ncbi:MAG: zinc metallopeptidase [Paludibacteraceae bacterium]|jgi:Zn-dependent membrane protease YugP|nr:zinc metallopeptidase [Paludibacteraceae bacterium]MBR4498989.1 zinc metallopeptidase [Paludibacteraceae bacterium]